MSSPTEIVAFLAENDVPFVDCRFSDILGREHHLTIPAERFDEDTIEGGIPFDGSSMPGWKGVEASDMLLMPDIQSQRLDPFRDRKSTRLNSSHVAISYAVFCLKKKKTIG